MIKIIYFIQVILSLLFFDYKKNKNSNVCVYNLPFDASYYLSIDEPERIKKHPDVKINCFQSKKFIKELNLFLNQLNDSKLLIEYNSIDIRVLIQYKSEKNQNNELAINRHGYFSWQGKIYSRNDTLLKIVNKYTKLSWE